MPDICIAVDQRLYAEATSDVTIETKEDDERCRIHWRRNGNMQKFFFGAMLRPAAQASMLLSSRCDMLSSELRC